jgi:hypothetical protein
LKYNGKNPAANYGIVEVVGSIPSGSTISNPPRYAAGFVMSGYGPIRYRQGAA